MDGVALMTDLSIWRGGSRNTKLKLHLHLPTFLYTTKHKHKTQNTKHKTQNTKHKTQNTVPARDVVTYGPELY